MTETLTAGVVHPHAELWDSWMRLWNGDYAVADAVVADDVVLHLPKYGMPDPAVIRTRSALTGWIAAFRSSYPEHGVIATDLGPFVVDDHVICRWIFQGTWEGGRPESATAAAGTPVTLRGADILRVVDGRIAEYWLSDDLLDVYVQLGAALPQA